jgi:hypothetical protein
LVGSLKRGSKCLLHFSNSLDFPEDILQNKEFYIPQALFTPDIILDEKYYKKKLLKPEEDIDSIGNKGGFLASKNFQLSLLISGKVDQLEKIFFSLRLDPSFFIIIKIVEDT